MSLSRAEFSRAPSGPDRSLPRDEAHVSGASPGGHTLPVIPNITVIAVSLSGVWRERLESALRGLTCVGVHELSHAGASGLLADPDAESLAPHTLLVVDHTSLGEEAMELVNRAHGLGMTIVVVCESSERRLAATARRRGACDLISVDVSEAELSRRLELAVRLAQAAAGQSRGVARLKRICRRLTGASRQVVRQTGSVWTDLVRLSREQSTTMNQVTLSSEYGGLIGHELDLEVLLRTTLEYVLSKSGPTNAAVFLPATSGDFSLGAYVNYDCPKETVDILLDHMANVVAPRFEHVPDIAHLTDPKQINEQVADDAMWIGDSHVIGFSCKHEGECLAIFLFFRDSHSPYQSTFINQLRVVRDLFAAQLARVIRIHHRHLPKEKWGALGDPPRDESDDGMV